MPVAETPDEYDGVGCLLLHPGQAEPLYHRISQIHPEIPYRAQSLRTCKKIGFRMGTRINSGERTQGGIIPISLK